MINKPSFIIKRPNDETVEFYVDGVQVGGANHDNVGWDGMKVAENLFRAVARELNVQVREK